MCICRWCYCFDAALLDLGLDSAARAHGTVAVVVTILLSWPSIWYSLCPSRWHCTSPNHVHFPGKSGCHRWPVGSHFKVIPTFQGHMHWDNQSGLIVTIGQHTPTNFSSRTTHLLPADTREEGSNDRCFHCSQSFHCQTECNHFHKCNMWY